MKLKLLSAAIAATFLAGCSSSGSSDNGTTPGPQTGVADVVYNEELHTAYIMGDEGNNAVVIGDGEGNAIVTVNGEIFTIQGDVVVNANGDIVGTVVTDNGVATVYINDKSYTLAVENGRLVIEGSVLDPEFGDDEWGPSAGNEFFANYMVVDDLGMPVALIEGDNGNYMWVIQGEDAYYLNINGSDAKPTHKIVDGEVLTMSGESTGITVETHRTDGQITHLTFNTPRGEEIIIRHEDGRLIATVFGHGHEHEGPDSAPTYGDIDDVLGTTIITLDNGETLILKDGALYHPKSDSGAAFNADGTITNMDGKVIAHGEMQELGFVVSLDNGAEITFRNDDGRLFAALTRKPIEHPIEGTPTHPIELDPSQPIRDGIIDHANIGESIDITINNRGHIIVENEMIKGDSGYRITEETTGVVIKNPKGETVGTLKSKELNYGLTYSLIKTEHGITIVQGRKNALGLVQIEGAKTITQDTIDDLKSNLQSLSQEQRQQIKQAVKDRASRS
ncbi:hypothetical protein AB6C81_01515 [Vibrio splendidus]